MRSTTTAGGGGGGDTHAQHHSSNNTATSAPGTAPPNTATTTTATNGGGVVLMDPKERIKRFGIECVGPAGDGITFLAGHWKPGGEHIQKLTVRNVSTTVKHLKYRLPSTRYFSLAYPEEIVLSPGMSQDIDVVFRPVHNDPYDDTIYFKVLDGAGNAGFHVPVRAFISKLQLSVLFGTDLGFCTTHQYTVVTFPLVNTGEVEAGFRWEEAAPFVLSPMSGSVPVGGRQDITVTIFPTDAAVFVVQAVCHVGEGAHANIPDPKIVTRLSAVSKFAFISLSEPRVDFGEVLCGTSPSDRPQEVVLRNMSVVPAEFELIRHESDRDEVFDITPKKGIVLPKSEVTVKVRYSALAPGTFSSDMYTFRTPGDCRTTLTCTGMATQPVVVLRKQVASVSTPGAMETQQLAASFVDGLPGAPNNSINFGEVELGSVSTRVFFLKNESAQDTPFCVAADAQGVFRIEPRQGVVPAGMETSVKMTFIPGHPINYYRRIFVLLGEALPLFIDAYGNGYIRAKGEVKEQRPAPLRHAHIQAYRNRCVEGKGELSPDELDDILEHMKNMDPLGALTAPEFAHVGTMGTTAFAQSAIRNPLTRSGETTRSAIAVAHEMFISESDPTGCFGVTIDRSIVDFGFAPVGAQALLTTSSSTSNSTSGGEATQVVSLTNHTRGKVCVTWCVPGANHAHDTSSNSTSSNALTKRPGQQDQHHQQNVFIIDPPVADIPAKGTVKFRITFRPNLANKNYVSELEAVAYFKNQRTFRLVNDTSLTPPWTLIVRASGHSFLSGQLLSKVRLCGGAVRNGKVVFPHTFFGDSTYVTVRMRNTSNLPSAYRFELGFASSSHSGHSSSTTTLVDGNGNTTSSTSADSEVFAVRPECGEVGAEDFVLVCIRFSPRAAHKKYSQLLRCIVNGSLGAQLLLEGASGLPCATLPDLLPNSKGSGSDIVPIGPSSLPSGFLGTLYMKPTAVGLSSSRTFRVRNNSRLPLRFSVTLPPNAAGIVSLHPTKGMLKGNEEAVITISFAPRAPTEYTYRARIIVSAIGGESPRVIDARQIGRATYVEPHQRMSFAIVAPGGSGAIVFDPKQAATPVQLVKTTETKAMTIENVSLTDLEYKLYYSYKYHPDAGASGDALEPIVSEVQEVEDRASNADDYEEHRSIYCDRPSGIIPAKSRRILNFSVNPDKAGLFEFTISSKLRAVGPDGSPVLVPNEEDVLLRTGFNARMGHNPQGLIAHADAPGTASAVRFSALMGEDDDHKQYDVDANFASTTIPPSSIDTDAITSSGVLDLPLVAEIVSRAAFPTVMFEDIRPESEMLICDIEQLWRQMSFDALNKELQIPLTDQEVKFNALSSPDLQQLKRFGLSFTPDLVGSPRQSYLIRMRNNGFLRTEFRLHFPNEKDLELEPWCDEDEPTPERLMHISIIEELRCFTIEPKHGVLEPGDTCVIRISYSHNSLKYGGVHRLPILMRVPQGKQFYIDIEGQTLENTALGPRSNTAAAITTNTSANATSNGTRGGGASIDGKAEGILMKAYVDNGYNYWLDNAPIGLPPTSAPVQKIFLANVCGQDLCYEVDTSSLRQFTSENMNIEAFKVYNRRGIVYSRNTTYLEVSFFPLEARTYTIPLSIKYFPISLDVLTLDHDAGGGGGGKSRAGGAKPSKKEMLLNTRYLEINVKCHGYHPRLIPRPVRPGTGFRGALPPTRQFLNMGLHMALSQDVVDFGVVPQCAISSRVIIIKNTSSSSIVDFVIDESSCSLFEAGVVRIYPSHGRTFPGDITVLHMVLNATCCPTILSDRVTIVTQEVISAKKITRGSRLQERLSSRGSSRGAFEAHESIVTRSTTSRSIQVGLMNEHGIFGGRVASLPGTGALGTGGGGRPGSSQSHVSVGSSSGMGLNFGDVGSPGRGGGSSGGGGGAHSPQRSTRQRSHSVASSQTPPTPDGSGRDHGGGSSSNNRGAVDSQSIVSGTSNHSSRSVGTNLLLGPRMCLNLRIKGEVYDAEVISKILHDESPKAVPALHSYVMPHRREHIPPKQMTPLDPRLEALDSMQRGSGHGAMLGTDDEGPGSFSSPMDRPRSATSLVPVGAKVRQAEVRDITTFLMADLFRSVVASADTRKQISDSVELRPSGQGLLVPSLDSVVHPAMRKLDLPLVLQQLRPVGRPECGVYYREVKEDVPLNELLVSFCRAHGMLKKWSEVETHLVQRPKPLNGRANSMLMSLDGIMSRDDNTNSNNPNSNGLLPSDYYVAKDELLEALFAIGVKKKGENAVAIRQRLAMDKFKFIDVKLAFLSKMDHRAVESIGRKLRIWETKQVLADKRHRQSSESAERIASATLTIQNAVRRKLARNHVEKKRNAQAKINAKLAAEAEERERQLLRKKEKKPTEAELFEQRKLQAAEKLQNVARTINAISTTERRLDDQNNDRASAALFKEPGVMELIGSILRYTMLNLVQEAVHEEFALDAEPIQIVQRPGEGTDASADADNNNYNYNGTSNNGNAYGLSATATSQ